MTHSPLRTLAAACGLAAGLLLFAAGCGKSEAPKPVVPVTAAPPSAAAPATVAATAPSSGTATITTQVVAAPKLPGNLTPVKLMLNWFPEAEHGGYYQAQLKGYYKDAGLDVEILKGGANSPVEAQVGTGRIEFGIVNADKLLGERASGVPIVALLAPFQISPRCIIVHDSSPMQSLADLHDTTLVASQTQAFVFFLRQQYGLKNVSIVPYKGGMATFKANPSYAIQGYVTSEPLTLTKDGLKPRAMLVADAGFNPYSSLLFTSEAMIKDHPDVVQAMVTASRRGWEEYLKAPGAANAAIQQQNPEMAMDVLNFGAEKQRDLMLTGDAADGHFGMMTLARWQTLKDQLIRCAVMKANPDDVSQAFTTSFLK